MKISDLMTRNLVTVSPDDSVERVVQLFAREGVRHILVLSKERLVGIISDRDIKRALAPGRIVKKKSMNLGGVFFLLEPMLVREIMTRDVVTVIPDLSAQEAAAIMLAERFGALPVVANGKLVGIITETDLLRYLASTNPTRASTSDRTLKVIPRPRNTKTYVKRR
jgi:acetoin utilization protein AcuB